MGPGRRRARCPVDVFYSILFYMSARLFPRCPFNHIVLAMELGLPNARKAQDLLLKRDPRPSLTWTRW